MVKEANLKQNWEEFPKCTHKERRVLESGRLGCALAVHWNSSLKGSGFTHVSWGQGQILYVKRTVKTRQIQVHVQQS